MRGWKGSSKAQCPRVNSDGNNIKNTQFGKKRLGEDRTCIKGCYRSISGTEIEGYKIETMTELALFSVLSAKCPTSAHVWPWPLIPVKSLQDLYFHSHYTDKESEVEELNASSRDELMSLWLQYQWSFLHNLSQPQETYLIIVDITGSTGPRVPPTLQLATYVSSHGVTTLVLCDWHRSEQGSFLNVKVSLCSTSNTWEKHRGVVPSIPAEESWGGQGKASSLQKRRAPRSCREKRQA